MVRDPGMLMVFWPRLFKSLRVEAIELTIALSVLMAKLTHDLQIDTTRMRFKPISLERGVHKGGSITRPEA